MLVGVWCVAVGVALLFVHLAVLSDCGKGVSCVLVGLCFCVGVIFSMGADCGVSTVNLFSVGATVVWCVRVLNALADVCLEVMGAVVHVDVPEKVSVVFLVCFG